MNIQVFKTHCVDCGEEVESRMGNLTGSNEVIVDFINDMEFECSCGAATYLQIEKHKGIDID